MPKAAPIISNFNAGELSPLLDGRTDLAKYNNGAHRLRNMIPTVQGPIERRAGFGFKDYAGANVATAAPSLTVEFVPTSTRPFVLEFAADGKFYVWFNQGRVLSGGVPVAVDYTGCFDYADLFDADGNCLMSTAESADVMYIAVPGNPPCKISRLSDTSWTIARITSDAGPWRDPNPTQSTTIYASAQTGSVTLIASASIFASSMVGMLVRLTQADLTSLKPWEPGQKNITVGTLRRSDGKTYKATALGAGSQPPNPGGAGTNKWTQTGSTKPIHTEGEEWDGGLDTDFVPGATTDFYTKGVKWAFQDPGYGVARITAYTSATQVTATVLTQLPASVVTAGNATWKWEFGAWAGDPGGRYPAAVCLWKSRLFFGGGIRVWGSVIEDYENFADKDFGEVLADSAVTVSVIGSQANDIVWMSPGDALAIGTTGGEFILKPENENEAFGPANAKVPEQSAYGSNVVRPLRIGQYVLFVQRGGRIVREYVYDFGADSYKADDVTVLSEHITQHKLVAAAFSRSARIAWFARGDGMLVGLTYDKAQDVLAWHAHPVTPYPVSAGVVCSLACVPSASGDYDDLYACIKRIRPTAPFDVTYSIEVLQQPYRDGDILDDQVYMDASLTYEGAPTTLFTGLDHLKGQTVQVLADGATHPDVVVDSGGTITLNRSASVVTAGLPVVAEYQGMRLEAGAADGTAQGKTKRIVRMAFRFLNTLGAKYGFLGQAIDTLSFRRASDPMGSPPPVFTGDKLVIWPNGYDTDARLYVRQDQPLPMTLVACMPQVTTEDG